MNSKAPTELLADVSGMIYIASKTKHAKCWRDVAEIYPVSSTWIYEAGEGETGDFNDLWRRCLYEAANSKAMVLYREADEVLKGEWIELGAALSAGVPVHAVGIEEYTVAKFGAITHYKTAKEAITAALKEPTRASSAVSEEAVEAAARKLAAIHYGARFERTTDNPLVVKNVDANWNMFTLEAKWALAAALPHLSPVRPEEPALISPEILDAHAQFGGDLRDMQRRYNADRPVEPVVKPLEWRKSDANSSFTSAETIVGKLRIWTHHEANGQWFWNIGNDSGDAVSEEEAKVIVTSLYVHTIRSALSAAPVRPAAKPVNERKDAWAALRMVRDAIGELFGPIASIESEEAVLLRGPEYHHEAEALIDALKRVGCPAEAGETSTTLPKPADPLVTVSIAIDRDGNVFDDVQTHGNTFADVYRGFVAVKAEIERQFEERRNCPFNPKYGKGIAEAGETST